MIQQLLRRVKAKLPFAKVKQKSLIPEGLEGIQQVGHRGYVGGLWEKIGRLQFEKLVSEGLQPHHYLLDVACGSLRGGVHFIPYLEPGRYLGMDKEKDLIKAGIEQELGQQVFDRQQPQFVVSSTFEFEKFGVQPDFALAQSLFTHLPAPMIVECLTKLRAVAKSNTRFYATFFESDQAVTNPEVPHDHKGFWFTQSEILAFGKQTGWKVQYIGDWKHPRQQALVCYHL